MIHSSESGVHWHKMQLKGAAVISWRFKDRLPLLGVAGVGEHVKFCDDPILHLSVKRNFYKRIYNARCDWLWARPHAKGMLAPLALLRPYLTLERTLILVYVNVSVNGSYTQICKIYCKHNNLHSAAHP